MEDEYKTTIQPQRRVNPNIKEVVKKEVIKLLDVGLIYPISDSLWVIPVQVVPKKGGMNIVKKKKNELIPQCTVTGCTFDHCLANLEKMLERCEEINLVLNWEKCHFMVKEGIVLDHKVLGSRIEVDNAKIESISKLPHPINIKAIRIFLGHAAFDKLKQELTQAPIMIKPDWSLLFEIMCDASDYAVVLGQRREKHFQPIHYSSKSMNEAQENYTTTEKELLAVVFAFDKFRQYLVCLKPLYRLIILLCDFTKQDAKPRLIRWILLVQEFYIKIRDKRGAENITANHLCRLENSELGKLTKGEIRDLFPEEQLMSITNDVL
ncbi:reverse transcriptase domain-containing protein [Tanacetum coccineum]